MTILALGSMLVGMVLGIRFRFIVLFPVLIVGSLALTAFALMTDETAGRTLLSIIVVAGVMQLGYVCTSLLSAFIFHGEEREQADADAEPGVARSHWTRVAASRNST